MFLQKGKASWTTPELSESHSSPALSCFLGSCLSKPLLQLPAEWSRTENPLNQIGDGGYSAELYKTNGDLKFSGTTEKIKHQFFKFFHEIKKEAIIP